MQQYGGNRVPEEAGGAVDGTAGGADGDDIRHAGAQWFTVT